MVEKRTIKVGNINHSINIYIERRNSTRASITKGGINIRIPKHLSKRNQEEEIHKLIVWAVGKIKEKPELNLTQKRYRHDEFLRTHTKTYQIKIDLEAREKNYGKIKGDYLHYRLPDYHSEEQRQETISKITRKLLAKEHLQELHYHVGRLNKIHFNKPIQKISYRYTISRWGACKHQTQEIELSTRLLLAPLAVLEYVIIHELAHLIEPNHSNRFWKLVQQADPNYKDKVKWLGKHGDKLNL
ncbi:MAG: putative metal-dependent hydrolase [Patescibacteria group bacterium]|jgi:predicted metal-dependent hydrolase